LLNTASKRSSGDAALLQELLVESDSAFDPQAFVLRPDVVLRLSDKIIAQPTAYLRTRAAVIETTKEIRRAKDAGEVTIATGELRWLDKIERDVAELPESEADFHAEMTEELADAPYVPAEYGL